MRAELTIAVPRGALFAPTLDALDGLAIDTSEVRANDRKLLFEDVGIVTMRPSDVPTYVEAGAADLGVTGQGGPPGRRGRGAPPRRGPDLRGGGGGGPRDHRQGRPRRAGRAGGLRARRPRLRAVPD